MFRAYFFLSVFFFSILFFEGKAFSQDDCNSCYQHNYLGCEQKCDTRDLDVKNRCSKNCLMQICGKRCGYSGTQVYDDNRSKESSLADCDFCQRKSLNNCRSSCQDKGVACERRCISSKCKSVCSMPAPPSSVLGSQSKTAEDCKVCRVQQESGCRSRCGSGAGSVSCALACQEEKCHSACLID